MAERAAARAFYIPRCRRAAAGRFQRSCTPPHRVTISAALHTFDSRCSHNTYMLSNAHVHTELRPFARARVYIWLFAVAARMRLFIARCCCFFFLTSPALTRCCCCCSARCAQTHIGVSAPWPTACDALLDSWKLLILLRYSYCSSLCLLGRFLWHVISIFNYVFIFVSFLF